MNTRQRVAIPAMKLVIWSIPSGNPKLKGVHVVLRVLIDGLAGRGSDKLIYHCR